MDDDLDADQHTPSFMYLTSVTQDSVTGVPAGDQYLAGNQDNCSQLRRDWSQGRWYSANASLGMATAAVKFLITLDRQPYPS